MSDDPSRPLPAVERMRKHWAVVSPLMGGTEAMRMADNSLLPKYPAEEDESYKQRLSVSTLLPAYSETVANNTSRVFAEPLQLMDDVPEKVAELCADIDLAGNDLNSWASELFQDALSHGLCHAWVEAPRAEGVRTVADEKAAGIRPYLVKVKPEQVLGWRYEGTKLVMFRYSEVIEEVDGAFSTKSIEQIRVLEPGKWTTYRKAEQGGQWSKHDEGTNSLPHIPLATFYTKRVSAMEAKPPLLELAHLNVKHWQSQSDQDNIVHMIRVPILVRLGMQVGFDGSGNPIPTDFHVGTGVVTDLPSDGDLKYVEHTGNAVEAGRKALEDLIEEMRMAGAKLIQKDKQQTKTAAQAKEEAAQDLSPLQRMATQFADCIALLLQYMADYVGAGEGGHVEMSGNFDQDYAPEVSLPQLLSMAQAGKLSNETLFAEFQRRGVISDEYKWPEELEKIESQGPALGRV